MNRFLLCAWLCFHRTRKNVSVVVLCCAVTIAFLGEISAQDASPLPTTRTAMVSVEAIDAYIAKARDDWQVPGLAVAIVHGDEAVLMKGYGVREVNRPELVDPQTLFAIASNSKAFTAAGLATLVDAGKLRWNDRVRQYLPWLEMYDPYVAHDLRIDDLLCHRSGLGTFSGDLLWFGTGYGAKEILQRAKYLKQEGPFRSHFGYSNLMYLAAGEVMEAVRGESWNNTMQSMFFDPLAMDRTITSVRELERLGNFATPHKTWLDRSEPLAWENWDSMGAAGGIISSVEDMSKWLLMLLHRGERPGQQRILPESAFAAMWESHTPIRISPAYSQRFPSTHFRAYGLGWMLADYQGRKIVSHGGGYDGMYSQVMLVPEEKLGVVVLTNSMTSIGETLATWVVDRYLNAADVDRSQQNLAQFRQSRQRFQERIDQAIKPMPDAPKQVHPLASYAGRYRCPMYGDVEIAIEGDHLTMRMVPNEKMIADLDPLHYDTFIIRWRNSFAWFQEGTALFTSDASGNLTGLELNVPNDDLWFHELQLRKVRNP